MDKATAVKYLLYFLALLVVLISGISLLKPNRPKLFAGIQIIIGFLIFIFSIADNKYEKDSSVKSADSIRILRGKIDTLNGLVKETKDTLLKIGIKVNDTTGKIIAINREILKAVLQLKQQPVDSLLPDSTNFLFELKNGILSIAPRQGVWTNFVAYLDTAHYKEYSLDNPFDGGSMIREQLRTIIVENKKLTVHRYEGFNPVRTDRPIRINISKHPNQYIIFEDEAGIARTYVYKNKQIKWHPDPVK